MKSLKNAIWVSNAAPTYGQLKAIHNFGFVVVSAYNHMMIDFVSSSPDYRGRICNLIAETAKEAKAEAVFGCFNSEVVNEMNERNGERSIPFYFTYTIKNKTSFLYITDYFV